MRTTVAGSVPRRLAMARTLSSTKPRGCSSTGRRISCRLAVRVAIRSCRFIVCGGAEAVSRFMDSELARWSKSNGQDDGTEAALAHALDALMCDSRRRALDYLSEVA